MKLKHKYKKFDDITLINKYKKSKNTYYIGVLFDRYYHLVFGLCLKYLNNIEDSKDAVISIFETIIIKSIDTDITNFYSWLYTISKNHCLNQIRSKKRTNGTPSLIKTTL